MRLYQRAGWSGMVRWLQERPSLLWTFMGRIKSITLNQTPAYVEKARTWIVHRVIWLFIPQLLLVLITPTHKGMARLSWLGLTLVDACVGLNWLLVSFLSHVNKNIIHSFIADYIIRRFTRHRCYLAYPSSNRPDEEQRVTIEPNRQWGRADDSSNLDET